MAKVYFCQWEVSDPYEVPKRKCLTATVDGHKYCEVHKARIPLWTREPAQ